MAFRRLFGVAEAYNNYLSLLQGGRRSEGAGKSTQTPTTAPLKTTTLALKASSCAVIDVFKFEKEIWANALNAVRSTLVLLPKPKPPAERCPSTDRPDVFRKIHPILALYGVYSDYDHLATTRRLLVLDASFRRTLGFHQVDPTGHVLSIVEKS